MTVTLKPQGSGQFLATLPALTGFIARNSLVVVFFSGKRSLGSFRLDLAEDGDLAEAQGLTDLVIATLRRVPGATGAVPVVYTDTAIGGEPLLPYSLLWSRLLTGIEAAGFDVIDACCVAADGWGSYLDDELPPGGRALSLIEHDPMRLDAMMAIDREIVDLEMMSQLPDADTALATATAVSVHRRHATLPASARLEETLHLLQLDLADLVSRVALGVAPPDPQRTEPIDRLHDVCLIARLDIVREIFLVGLAFGTDALNLAVEEAARTRVQHTKVASVAYRIEGSLIAIILRGVPSAPPNRERLHAAIEVLRACSTAADDELRLHLQAMLAWIWWALGVSSVSERLLEAVVQECPDHALAGVFADLCFEGVQPGWAVLPGGSVDASS